jgi:hypothetical protein
MSLSSATNAIPTGLSSGNVDDDHAGDDRLEVDHGELEVQLAGDDARDLAPITDQLCLGARVALDGLDRLCMVASRSQRAPRICAHPSTVFSGERSS